MICREGGGRLVSAVHGVIALFLAEQHAPWIDQFSVTRVTENWSRGF
jgi:hypothetical protein